MLLIETSPLCDCVSKLWRGLRLKPACTRSQLRTPGKSPALSLYFFICEKGQKYLPSNINKT